MTATGIFSKWKWIAGVASALILSLVLAIVALLSSLDLNGLKPAIEGAVKDTTGRRLTLGGDIRIKVGLTPTLVLGDVSFQNASWGTGPDLAKIKRFELKVKLLPLLSRRVEVRRLALVEPEILLETDAKGRSNLAFGPAEKKTQTEGSGGDRWKVEALTFDDLRIEKGTIVYRGHASKKTYTMAVDVLTATARSSESPPDLRLKGTYNSVPMEVTGKLCPFTAFVNPDRPWPLDLSLKAGDVTFAVAGTVVDPLAASGLRLKFTLKCKDLSSLGRFFGQTLSLPGPFESSGELADPKRSVYSISNLFIKEGGSDLTGSVQADLTGERPKLTSVLSAKKLDLRPYMETKSHPRPKERLFSDQPLPLEALKVADVDLKLDVAAVLLPGHTLQGVEMGLFLKGGAIQVNPFRAVMGGGAMEGSFTLRPEGPTAIVTATAKVNKVGIAYLAKELEGVEALEGTVNMDMDVAGRGASVAGVMGSLNGKAILTMGKGKVSNKYISLLSGGLATSILRLVNPYSERSKHIVIVNCLVCGFNIKGGRAEATALVVNTDQMVVVGDGDIDLRTEKLNLSLKPVPKKGLGLDLPGNLRISLNDLSSPLRLKGTLAHPDLTLDPTQSAISLGKVIGEVVLFGPAGIAGALVGIGRDNENSCVEAIAAAKKGVREGSTGSVTEGVEGILKGAGKTIEKLFTR